MAPSLVLMPQRLTPGQRKTYDGLRMRLQRIMTEYEGYRQHTLAESVGASQALVSQVLRGRTISIPILERLARVLMLHLSQSDRRTLRAQLETALQVLRNHHGKSR